MILLCLSSYYKLHIINLTFNFTKWLSFKNLKKLLMEDNCFTVLCWFLPMWISVSSQQCESMINIHKSPPSEASLSPPQPTPLGHHIAPGWARVLHSSFPLAICFTYRVCISVLLSQFASPFSFPCCVHKPILNVCDSIPGLQIGSSVPFF